MASENFNNNSNNQMFLERNYILNKENKAGEMLKTQYSNTNMSINYINMDENNTPSLNSNNATNSLLNKYEYFPNIDSSEFDYKNKNEINEQMTFIVNSNPNPIGDAQESNYNNFYNDNNASNKNITKDKFQCDDQIYLNNRDKIFNNSINLNLNSNNTRSINKSTNNNTRFSCDNHENSKINRIQNQTLNINWNDYPEGNEINLNRECKNPASKRNYSLNPQSLRSIDNKNKEFYNSAIYKNHMNIIPEITIQPHASLTETKNKNLILKVETENSICHSCHEIVEDNEIIYFCSCERIFHFTCLTEYLFKKCQTIHIPCAECGNQYKIYYFKLIQKDEEENPNSFDYTEIERSNWKGKTIINRNNTIYLNNSSVIDTNINNLDNYEAFCGLAMQINHESMSELISKNENIKNASWNATPNSIGRIPLSPIPLNITPYTGRARTKNVSYINENSENNNFNDGNL